MPKKQSTSKALLLRDIRDNLKSFVPIQRNGWVVKLSTYRDTNILLIFSSVYTGQSFIQYFDDEDKAVDYINIIVTKNPNEILALE